VATLRLYLISQVEIVQVAKEVAFERVPVPGEWVRFGAGGLLPHPVTEVTHCDTGGIDVVLGAFQDRDGKWNVFETHEELEEELSDQIKAGWQLRSRVPNRLYRNDA
jgi:hypothetical protein